VPRRSVRFGGDGKFRRIVAGVPTGGAPGWTQFRTAVPGKGSACACSTKWFVAGFRRAHARRFLARSRNTRSDCTLYNAVPRRGSWSGPAGSTPLRRVRRDFPKRTTDSSRSATRIPRRLPERTDRSTLLHNTIPKVFPAPTTGTRPIPQDGSRHELPAHTVTSAVLRRAVPTEFPNRTIGLHPLQHAIPERIPPKPRPRAPSAPARLDRRRALA
jgi:hypothetical protein